MSRRDRRALPGRSTGLTAHQRRYLAEVFAPWAADADVHPDDLLTLDEIAGFASMGLTPADELDDLVSGLYESIANGLLECVPTSDAQGRRGQNRYRLLPEWWDAR
jgi:hypothetical protein